MLAASRAEATMASLADHVIGNHMPEIAGKGYAAFLSEVVVRSARMVAGWQSIGFVHGVMNTDNMSILGITIDYGPFGFMERFDPDFVPNTSVFTRSRGQKAKAHIFAIRKRLECRVLVHPRHTAAAAAAFFSVSLLLSIGAQQHPHDSTLQRKHLIPSNL